MQRLLRAYAGNVSAHNVRASYHVSYHVSYHIYSCENNQYIVKVAYCKLLWSHIIEKNILPVFVPRCEKTGIRGFRPCQTQTKLYSHRRWLKA